MKKHNLSWWILFLSLIYIVLVIKLATITEIDNDWFFGIYSILVSTYIMSRFLLAHFYNPVIEFDPSYQPTVTFITPAKNEAGNIAKTLRALLASDYPKELFEVITVNDGSTDDTLSEMLMVKAEAEEQGIAMKVIDWPMKLLVEKELRSDVATTTTQLFNIESDPNELKPKTDEALEAKLTRALEAWESRYPADGIRYEVEAKRGAGHHWIPPAKSLTECSDVPCSP